MDNLELRISALRRQAAEAVSQKARAEHELTFAEGQRDSALKALEAEFGVTSIDKARELLSQVEADLAAEVGRVEVALSEAGHAPAS